MKAPLPSSATVMPINYVGALAAIAAIALLRWYDAGTITLWGNDIPVVIWGTVLVLLAFAVTVVALEAIWVRPWQRPTTGLDWNRNTPDTSRLLTKLAGLYTAVGLIVGGYWIFPEYGLYPGGGNWYGNYWPFALTVLGVVLIGGIPYFWWLDRHQVEPEDGYYHLGLMVRGRIGAADKRKAGQVFLGWLVKGFFLALMTVFCCNDINWLMTRDPLIRDGYGAGQQFMFFYQFAYKGLFLIDVTLATVGYILTLRIFDTHIRSTEPTMFGWGVALFCYPPFYNVFNNQYLAYGDQTPWGTWLQEYPFWYCAWGGTILVLLSVYVWGTIAFGIRFSNLTHRGIITAGPYRWCKHPAYLAKNISWWLISVPFITADPWHVALRHCLLLALMNLIYYLRARTEERHLSADPTYVAYALAMNERGVSGLMSRLLPFLRYREPTKKLVPTPVGVTIPQPHS